MSRYSKSKEKVMLDCETLSLDIFTAPMISLGAVKFMASGEITDKFQVNIDVHDLINEYGFKANKETVKWWMDNHPEVLKTLQTNTQSLSDAISMFEEWYGDSSLETHTNGIDFDFPIIKRHFQVVGKTVPWKYWDQSDFRTVIKIFGLNNQEIRNKSDLIYHDPVHDCISQIETLTTILKPIWNPEDD